ncbi:FAD-dependent oxidoreductase [Amycolatopsis acidicola]|uniref:FAD-dependent oxidoreductase n=1 Tax=Amycolatopsis acidicola TaxID=2596893 RepID=A0A5N0VHX5_9PSEU|nr:FAD-dependent monooxygenase [Amycolatopsis acidicola]KAA9165755.1 FAD-dependent oxidoreductase [Amycolatopsis acidicola]
MDFPVVVAGGGPVGLMLACELRLAGVDVLVVERLSEIDPTIKAGSINLPTAEAFYRRGMYGALEEHKRQAFARMQEFFKQQGGGAPVRPPKLAGHFGGIMVAGELVDFDSPGFRDPGPAASITVVGQQAVEEVLSSRAAELGVVLRRGVEVTGFDADEDGVTVRLGDESVRAGWLVGCDGGRSLVRKLAGFDFPGTDPEITGRQALVEMTGAESLPRGWNRTDTGLFVNGPMPGRILTVEFGPPEDREAPITAEELQGSLRRVSGVEVTITAVHTATRFTDNARQASTYRKGRVLLAGDAAHVHSPFGGQGLNLGIGDAMNLGWKLAATINGWAPQGLLDTYDLERHPIGEWVLDWTRAQVAVMRPDPRTKALRAVVGDLLSTGDGQNYLAKKLSGVLHRYPIDGAHELTGLGAPDFEFSDGTRFGEYCQEGLAVLLDLADSAELRAAVGNRASRVRVVTRQCVSDPKLTGVLVRPDGHVAWASDGGVEGLEQSLATWF